MTTAAVLFDLLLISISRYSDGEEEDPRVVLGHRGAAGIYPEHTLIAYEKGADLGADFIECDLQVTKVCQQSSNSIQFVHSARKILHTFAYKVVGVLVGKRPMHFLLNFASSLKGIKIAQFFVCKSARQIPFCPDFHGFIISSSKTIPHPTLRDDQLIN